MLLTIDIGNTNIVLGVFDKEKLLKTWRLQTDQEQRSEEYRNKLKQLFAQEHLSSDSIHGVIIGSVVPILTPKFVSLSGQLFSCQTVIVGANSKLPITLAVDNPNEVGADIIANAVAAHEQYPSNDVIVVDFGTATTFDVVTKKGEYVGSVFAPNIKAMATSLTQSAALLPTISVAKPKAVIGKNSVDCIISGIVYGYIGLVEGILHRIKTEYKQAIIIATGGYSNVITGELSSITVTIENLTLEGLCMIYRMNQPNSAVK